MYAAANVIIERHNKPLTSEQRKQLKLKSYKDAEDLVHDSILKFCHSCATSGLNVVNIVQKYSSLTKNQRLEIFKQTLDLQARENYIRQKLNE